MSKNITVGISDLNIAKAPDVLVTYALGSCVGICLYDGMAKIGGLSHIMLPTMVTPSRELKQIYRFADTAIPTLVHKLEQAGARPVRLKAKIAGGAQMFATAGGSSLSNIGQRNVQAVKQALQKLNIPIIAEDTGKNYGRTLYFNVADGTMRIKSAIKGEWTW